MNRYFPLPLGSVVKQAFALLIIAGIVLNLTLFKDYVFIPFIVAFALIAFLLILASIKLIRFAGGSIRVSGDVLPFLWKVQYRVEIPLAAVKSIRLVKVDGFWSSRGRESWGHGFERRILGHRFLEFIDAEGGIKRICVNDFSEKDIARLCRWARSVNDAIVLEAPLKA